MNDERSIDQKLDALLVHTGQINEKVTALSKRTDRIEEALIALTRTEEKVAKLEEEIKARRQTEVTCQDNIWRELRSIDDRIDKHDIAISEVTAYVGEMKLRNALSTIDQTSAFMKNVNRIFIGIVMFFIIGILGSIVTFNAVNSRVADIEKIEKKFLQPDDVDKIARRVVELSKRSNAAEKETAP